MTLVAALSIDGYTRLFADTRISHPDATQVEQLPGRLKLLVMHRYLCIGYSGGADFAIDTIRALSIDRNAEMSDAALVSLLPPLLRATSGGRVEFLIAAYIDGRGTILLKLADRAAYRYGEMAWIGDEDAFDAVASRIGQTKIDFKPDDPRGLRWTFQYAAEFAAVVHRHVVESVGGIPIGVELQPSGFRYMHSIGCFFPDDHRAASYSPPLVFGSAAEGGFAYTVLPPRDPTTAALGLHFHQGNVGYLYLPVRQDRPCIYTDVTCEDFRRRVFREEALRLDGFCAGRTAE